jgi:hypothetical protein
MTESAHPLSQSNSTSPAFEMKIRSAGKSSNLNGENQMAHGDLPIDAAHKPNKGLEDGACNRQRCQAEPANWYNHGSYAWYCADCRNDIQFDDVNLRHWEACWQPECGHPQFETREQMNAREGTQVTAPLQSEWRSK